MTHYDYLIVGAGMTGDAAVRGIRETDPTGSIAVIGIEPDPPYNRPPLSKGLWKGKPLDGIWCGTQDLGADLHLGREARTLDLQDRRVVDARGTEYGFDKLLLATGGTPRRLPFGGEEIIYFRTVEDYRRLRALAEGGRRFGVIGGGFIGSEIAAALRMIGKEVVMVFPEEAIGGRVFPRQLGLFLNDYFCEKGVQVLAGNTVTAVARRGTQWMLQTQSGQELAVDGLVAGIGIEPNVELARASGLPVDNGIVVDEFLRTSDPAVYAAGDVAAFHNPALAKRIRVEHEDNALTMGRLAGRNMAGEAVPYHHLPFFYSDLFDLGYEAVGELNAQFETVADWQEPYRKGVVYYLDAGRVRGVLLWNVWEQVEAASSLVAQPGPFDAADLKGRIAPSK